jgi:hypothetical protein
MTDPFYITTVLQVSLYSLILFLAFIYSCSILFIRRFHHHNNIFILNICLTIIGTCLYFIIYFTMLYFDLRSLYAPNMCIVLLYAYNIASIGIPFGFLTFSVHRFCSIVYHTKPFFKTKRWMVICIGCQWTSEFIISLPFIFRSGSVSRYIFL